MVIRLRQASKLIDRLRSDYGLRGPIVGFKYEAAPTVIASAEALRKRVSDLTPAQSADLTHMALHRAAFDEVCARLSEEEWDWVEGDTFGDFDFDHCQ